MIGTTTPIFGKAIYEKLLDLDTKEIVSLIDEARKPYKETEWKGKEKLYVLEQEKFKFLKDIILNEFKHYFSGVLKYTNEFRITTSWFTVIKKNKDVQIHNHHNCFMSGVLYLQVDDKTGDFVFQDFNNKRQHLIPTEYNIYNSNEWRFKPRDGLLLFFPSEMHHLVETNKSNITRHSLAFNIIPTGLIGDETSDSHAILK